MSEILTTEEDFDPEVWGYFAHGEPKDFNSSPSGGLIRPKPVRPVASLTWDDDEPSTKSETPSRQHSLFLPTVRGLKYSNATFQISSAKQEMAELLKRIKVKDDEIIFQKLQRTDLSEREEELRTRLTSMMDEMSSVRAELEHVRLHAQNLQLEDDSLQTQVRNLTAQKLTHRESMSRLIQAMEGGLRSQRGGGEGVRVRRKSLAERSGVTQATRFDQLDISGNTVVTVPCSLARKASVSRDGMHSTAVCDLTSWECPFVSPVKFDKAPPFIHNDSPGITPTFPAKYTSAVTQMSNEKISRSLVERVRSLFTRIRG